LFEGMRVNKLEPVNDIWYKDCFYNALIPIIKYYIGRLDCFLICDFYHEYRFFTEKGVPVLRLESEDDIDIQSALLPFGISYKTYRHCRSLKRAILSTIQKDGIALVMIDCFEDPLREDTFGKNHWQHIVSCYGFCHNQCCIIDSDFIDSERYTEKNIGFSDLQRAHDAAVKEFHNGVNFMTFGRLKTSKCFDKDYFDGLIREKIRGFIAKRERNERSVEQILKFSASLDKYCASGKQITCLETTVKEITNIIHTLRVSRYLFEVMFGLGETALRPFDSSIRLWSSTRGLLTKLVFMETAVPKYCDMIRANLEKIKISEAQRFRTAYDMLEEWMKNAVYMRAVGGSV